jgi:hypothetical protein
MRFFRLLVATLWLAAFGFSAAPAHAIGTITYSPPSWKNRVDDRPIALLNRRDCLDGAVASFSYSIQGISSGAFEVWSGANCDDKNNRTSGGDAKTCARVAVGSIAETRIELSFREMVKTYGLTEDVGLAGCDMGQGIGKQTRNLFFVVYDLNTLDSLARAAPWKFDYDIIAPKPPTNVSAASGDLTLVTSFTPTSETDLLHYRFYCSLKGDPPVTSTGGTAGTDTGGTAGTDTAGTDTGGTAGTDTAGTAGTEAATGGADTGGADTGGTAGTDTGGTAGNDATSAGGTSAAAGTGGTVSATNPDCTSSTLVAGQPVPKGAMACGMIGALTSKGGETDPVLTNDTSYVVAVAAEDDANNVGVLSNLACARPQDVTGFYEAYNEAGGDAGGGFCTFAPARRDAWATGIALLLGAGALWRRRK